MCKSALVLLTLGILLLAGQQVLAKFPPGEVPTFKLRTRVTSFKGAAPDGSTFTFKLGTTQSVVTGGGWSEWLTFTSKDAESCLGPHAYPNNYLRSWPVVTWLTVLGVEDTTVLDGEIVLDEQRGKKQKFTSRLYGWRLGLLIWRDGDGPHVATMADYNRRYWDILKAVEVKTPPTYFPIIDRFIGGDNDRRDWETGITALSKAGFSAIMLPPDKNIHDMLTTVELKRTAWAVYSPPGSAHEFSGDPARTSPEGLAKWANELAKPYSDAGYAPTDMAAYALADEPGWYMPAILDFQKRNPAAMARFRQYLQDQGLRPRDVGAARWDDVQPIGRSQVMDTGGKPAPIEKRRLFYWSMRFLAWDSTRYYADCTAALEKAFYPGMPIFVNWNFFSGRLYVPGPVGNNPAKTDPDAAMGCHDWLEFGRMRGSTMLWTEDWFRDRQAFQWSFYCAKLRCGAEKGKIAFGGYVVPRTAGDREDGILQKILCIVGSGGKAIKYFVFGPEYNFPTNCYSENAKVLPKMAEAHGMIGAAERVLWPGMRPKPQVAILSPRSAEMWDLRNIDRPYNAIYDATNMDLNYHTMDYMAEVFDLYVALQHANIPVDFVEEEDLTPVNLHPYKVLYVTEPNIPIEGQRGLVAWVKGGGTLVTVTGAGAADRYNDPCDVLAKGIGIRETPRERTIIPNLASVPKTGLITRYVPRFLTYGPRGTVEAPEAETLVAFSDGAPALLRRAVGKGMAYHFACLPGLSYMRSGTGDINGMLAGFTVALRDMIVMPTQTAGVVSPVTASMPMLETPMLLSEAGAGVTVLNWVGEQQAAVTLQIRVPFVAQSVASVKQGALTYTQEGDVVTCTLSVGAADIVMLSPKPGTFTQVSTSVPRASSSPMSSWWYGTFGAFSIGMALLVWRGLRRKRVNQVASR